MTIQEITQKVKELRAANEQLRNTAEAEKRALNAEELDKINANINEITKLHEERAMQVEELRGVKAEKPQNTLVRALKNAIENGKRSVSFGMDAHETRAIDFSVAANGGGAGGIVPTESLDILEPLRNRMLLGQAGATYLTGLTGDVKIPLYSGSKAFWADENAAAQSGAGTFSNVALTPKRLAAQISVSRRALVQAPAGLEAMLQNDLVNAIADALESTILGNGAGSDNTPKGIFNGAAAVDLTFENVVALEEGADAVNALTDNAQYLMSTSAWAKAKTTTKSESVVAGFILEPGNTMNGYPAKRSNNVKGIAFGDWSELVIGQWGDIVLDLDYQATTDSVVITINSMWDAAIRREGAIQAKTITA